MKEYGELLKMLDLERGDEFEYFENMADLLEAEEEVPDELVAKLLTEVDREKFSKTLMDYFNDILGGVPESDTDLYTLLQTIGLSLSEMVKTAKGDDLAIFCDEFIRFKNWYGREKCVKIREGGGDFEGITPLDALTLAREDRLMPGRELEFDFEGALEYELRDYIISFSDVANLESQDDSLRRMQSDEDYDSPEALLAGINKAGGVLPEGFLYEDEIETDFEDL